MHDQFGRARNQLQHSSDQIKLVVLTNGVNGCRLKLIGETMDMRDFGADKVRQLIADYIGVDASQVTDEAHLSDDLGVDWLDQLELLVLIEDEFVGVEFSDVTAIDVVGDLIRHMEKARHVVSVHRRSAA